LGGTGNREIDATVAGGEYVGPQGSDTVCQCEESGQQVKLRSQRLGVANPVELSSNGGHKSGSNGEAKTDSEDNSAENFYLLPETDLEVVLRELEALKPNVAVIDSIQTIYFASLTSAPGSVAQVRECTSALMQVAKRENITLFIVGHVTKDGALAGRGFWNIW
jgi:Predicted ATP-dependent serine protease